MSNISTFPRAIRYDTIYRYRINILIYFRYIEATLASMSYRDNGNLAVGKDKHAS